MANKEFPGRSVFHCICRWQTKIIQDAVSPPPPPPHLFFSFFVCFFCLFFCWWDLPGNQALLEISVSFSVGCSLIKGKIFTDSLSFLFFWQVAFTLSRLSVSLLSFYRTFSATAVWESWWFRIGQHRCGGQCYSACWRRTLCLLCHGEVNGHCWCYPVIRRKNTHYWRTTWWSWWHARFPEMPSSGLYRCHVARDWCYGRF